MRTCFCFLGLALVAGVLLATAVPARSQSNVPPAPAGFELDGDPDSGEIVYKQYCLKCHGKRGTGTGIAAKDLDPKPADFTDEESMSELSDWELFLGIRDGGKPFGLSDQMTAWKGTLEEEDMHDVAVFIRQFAQ